MRSIPLDIGALHFVGIGGIGMSGIAEILHNLGYVVQGSDVAENANVQRLRGLGIKCAVGHDAANLGEARVVVVSTAITNENPEVAAARAAFIPIVRRAEMLAELMRLKWSIAVGGTHGKTTTTSLISTVLDSSKLDPTIINGGIINAYGTNARLGQGDWMVVEADESDGTFLKLPATVAVVTNIDPEHLDHYGTFDKIREAFRTFIENLPFYGSAVMCIDHPEVQALIAKITDRRILSYGLSPQADLRATDLRMARDGATFAVTLADRRAGTETDLGDFHSPMLGEHNVRNALAAIGVGLELKIPADTIRTALSGFEGVKRRFTRTGEVNGITVIDDYGHHPVEISATLKAGRQHTEGRVIAVMQPHRYTRLRDLFEDFCTCFNDADTVIITDVYAAGEEPIEGVSRDDLVNGLIAHGHRHAIGLESRAALASTVLENATSGDVVICLGAGTISAWAQALPEEMEKHVSV